MHLDFYFITNTNIKNSVYLYSTFPSSEAVMRIRREGEKGEESLKWEKEDWLVEFHSTERLCSQRMLACFFLEAAVEQYWWV